MTLQSLTAATVLLLASSLAFAEEPVKTEKPKDVVLASAAGAGSAAVRTDTQRARAPTREEVKAEAVEAAKHHRATLSESLDFLKN